MSLDVSGTEFAFLLKQLELGNVVLFCGAGFSCDGTNREGSSPPMANGLASQLAELAGLPFDNESLPVVFHTVRKRVGKSILNECLKNLYDVTGLKEWYKIVKEFVWFRIYTTNIDNLLQRIYALDSSQKLDTVVCPAAPIERDYLFSRLQAVHLHGHIDQLDKGVTFSLQEFAEQQVTPNPWYQTLIDDLFFRPIVFVGTLLEESPFQHYVALRAQKAAHYRETRPKSYLVSRAIGPIRAESLKDQNILPVEATAEEFFAALRSQLSGKDLDVRSVARRVFPHQFMGPEALTPESVIRFFDPILADSLPNNPRSLPNSFYLGAEPTWKDIAEERDGVRDVLADLTEDLARHNDSFQCIVLHGPAGSGKTTILKRTAYNLAVGRKYVYYAKGDQLINLAGIMQVAKSNVIGDQRVFVFIDNLAKQLTPIYNALPELLTIKRLSLILADRTNVYSTRAHALDSSSPTILRVKDLTEPEVTSILQCLQRFNFLGALLAKTHEQRVDEFMKKASRQLLVAMKEATSGKGFDEILKSEFNELIPDAKLAYTICCLAVAQGAPGVYRRHLFPCLGKTDFRKDVIVSELLNGVLVTANEVGTLLKPRHRVIAYEIANQIAPGGLKLQAILAFLKQICTSIVPNEIRAKGPAFLAYRGLINSEALYNLFGGDREIILGLYEELESFYKDHYLFWLHYAMAYISQGDLDVGETYLAQASAICERVGGNPFQIQHQQAILVLTQASRIHPPTVGVERANQGMNLLQDLIRRRGDHDSYPYVAYLDYVTRWYVHAGKLISDNEWEAIRKVGKEAERKFPLEEMLREAIQKVERAYLFRIVREKPTFEGM
jgi:hypothetical protein